MRILGIVLGTAALLVGFRLIYTAIRIVISGNVLVRQGVRTRWQPAPSVQEAWKAAFREALMGLLFVILGVALLS